MARELPPEGWDGAGLQGRVGSMRRRGARRLARPRAGERRAAPAAASEAASSSPAPAPAPLRFFASPALGPPYARPRQLAVHIALSAASMPVTEKDLAEDAPWKKIQQNTFTRWCNEHLKCVNKRIGNLQTDLSDGLRLIALLEVLSQKHMYRKYHQRPTFRQMQLENVSVALEFLDRENIKLVSIGECPGRARRRRCTPRAPARAPPRGLKLPVARPHGAQQPRAECGLRGRGTSSLRDEDKGSLGPSWEPSPGVLLSRESSAPCAPAVRLWGAAG